jgi:hypothetical protein
LDRRLGANLVVHVAAVVAAGIAAVGIGAVDVQDGGRVATPVAIVVVVFVVSIGVSNKE